MNKQSRNLIFHSLAHLIFRLRIMRTAKNGLHAHVNISPTDSVLFVRSAAADHGVDWLIVISFTINLRSRLSANGGLARLRRDGIGVKQSVYPLFPPPVFVDCRKLSMYESGTDPVAGQRFIEKNRSIVDRPRSGSYPRNVLR